MRSQPLLEGCQQLALFFCAHLSLGIHAAGSISPSRIGGGVAEDDGAVLPAGVAGPAAPISDPSSPRASSARLSEEPHCLEFWLLSATRPPQRRARPNRPTRS